MGLELSARIFIDAFCGAGGAADGYRAVLPTDVEIWGVDIVPQPRYPYNFVQGDALDFLARWGGHDDVYAVHASPPCQRYSDLGARNANRESHPDLVGDVRALLAPLSVPTVMENVPEAPLVNPVILCGTRFPSLRVIRHRAFETSFPVMGLKCERPHPRVFTHDKRKKHYGLLDPETSYIQVTGGGNSTVAQALSAMGIDRPMTKKEVNEAIPPAYASYIGAWLVDSLWRPEPCTCTGACEPRGLVGRQACRLR